MDEWEGAGKTAIIISGWNPATGDPEALITNGAGALQVSVAGVVSTGALTDAQLRAAPVDVSAYVGQLPVSLGSQYGADSLSVVLAIDQAAIPVSGPLTDAQLRAATVPISQALASALNAQVVGSVASGATDAGNPVKVAARYNLTLATLSDGQRSDLTVDSRQALQVTLMTRGSGTAFMSAGSPGRVDPTGTTTQPVSIAALVSVQDTTLAAKLGNTSDAEWDRAASAGVIPILKMIGLTLPSQVGQNVMTDSLSVTIASNQSAVPVSGPLTDAQLRASAVPVSGTVNQSTGQGKTLLFGSISQGAAGTTQLVAADATKKVKLVSYVIVLDAAGSVKFSDGTVDLSGVMPMAANGGVASPGQPAAHLLETAAINRPLNIVTVGGKAFGHFSYFLEA